ncbi:MAG: MBL fold metallo-hydrolase, partial [Planctomycetota bacterium]
LQTIGLNSEDVTDVVITHLHFDHNGGLTDWFDEPDGPTCLRYPQARHWVHKRHWEHANAPNYKDRASFLEEDFAALAEADVLCFVDGEHPDPPFEGMEWFVSQGHTPCQLHPIFGTGDEKLLFIGDIAPTVAHLPLSWVMAYDNAPLQTIAEKETIFRRCLDEGLLLAFPHDPKVGGVAIDGKPERPIVARALPL